jgi:signal transduction histidine kinase/ActR/RegA family two-component response regulator
MLAEPTSERVLIVAPMGHDASAALAMLERGGLSAGVCNSVGEACREAGNGIGVLVIAEEAFSTAGLAKLASLLDGQPAWSDVPVIALTRGTGGRTEGAAPPSGLQRFNVTILERPLYVQTFVAAVQVALRARRRQYEVRFLLEQRAYLLEREREARERAESASRAKDDFLAMLGHELRNPLAPIVTALHLLRARNPQEHARELTILDRQVSHLARLVDDLLDVSRIAQGKIELKHETVDLVEVMNRAIEMTSPLIEQRRHRLEVNLQGPPYVRGDATRLAQVVANLLTNAAKYSEPGGLLRLTASREQSMAMISVRDDGIGIPPELLGRVFDLFVQGRQASDRAQGGLGLGLSIVKNLVLLHGGTVEARSDGRGCGSEFIVRLPALSSSSSSSRSFGNVSDRETPPSPQRLPRVLVVDDNEDAAEMLALSLSTSGYSTRIAHDGPYALRVAEEFCPDVAVLDIGLPVMDGYELARQLRGNPHLSKIRLVALTGYGQPDDVRRAREAGFDEHFVKPIDVPRLQAKVSQLLTSDAAHA